MKAQKNDINPVLGINNLRLKLRVMRLASHERRKPSQMAKLLLEQSLEIKEKALGLGPIENWDASSAHFG
ncbi:hypothetical protein SG34_005010 [Thalassomonas viridans]|uniref:Uncharacterized protein n=1 Tax=Thalassomonas viridans TaxID=137584 RepID=A0AAE9Z711_9GAMM|nr:hypothetical protein [Thalassomonas viridans]WDE06287.1 hypothetical protein SG34_005010 [Thalassomonas viridans]